MRKSTVEEQLLEAGYVDLFQRMDQARVEEIWRRHDGPAELMELVADEDAHRFARFLAAEILFTRQQDFPPEALTGQLAEIYTRTLQDCGSPEKQAVLAANNWGFPFRDDDPGVFGAHVLSLGEGVLPHLLLLLDDDRQLTYEGSREAVKGNASRYRVKDVAAFYISLMKGLDVRYEDDLERRDRQIDRLREKVAADGPRNS